MRRSIFPAARPRPGTGGRSRRRSAPELAKAAVTVAVTAGVCVVSIAGYTPSADVPVPLQPEPSVDAWTMPLDSFTGADPDAVDAAEWELLRPCLAGEGWAVNIPDHDADVLLSPGRSFSGVGLVPPLSSEQAARWAHLAPREGNEAEWRRFRTEHNADPALAAALDVCLPAVRTGALAPWQGQEATAQARARDLRQAARFGALSEPAVRDAAEEWRQCLQPAAPTRSLPDDPMSLLEDRRPGEVSASPSAPTADAVRFAEADVNCQRSSGWREALYDAQWRRESLVSERDAALFARVGDAFVQQRGAVRAALTSG